MKLPTARQTDVSDNSKEQSAKLELSRIGFGTLPTANLHNRPEISDTTKEETSKRQRNETRLFIDNGLSNRDLLFEKINSALSEFSTEDLERVFSECSAIMREKDETKWPPLPEKAPALWSERTTGRKVSPVEFIKSHYGAWSDDKWYAAGLSRAGLKHLDPNLYQAYATWIRRHPEDDLGLPTKRELNDREMARYESEDIKRFRRINSAVTRRAR